MSGAETVQTEISAEYIDKAHAVFEQAGLSLAEVQGSDDYRVTEPMQLQIAGADNLDDIVKHLAVGALHGRSEDRIDTLAGALQYVGNITQTIKAGEPFAWLTSYGGNYFTAVTVALADGDQPLLPEKDLMVDSRQAWASSIRLALFGSEVSLGDHGHEPRVLSHPKQFKLAVVNGFAKTRAEDDVRHHQILLIGEEAINEYLATFDGKRRLLKMGISAEMLGDSSWITADRTPEWSELAVGDDLKQKISDGIFHELVSHDKLRGGGIIFWPKAGAHAALRFAGVQREELVEIVTKRLQEHANDPWTSAVSSLAARKAVEAATVIIDEIYAASHSTE